MQRIALALFSVLLIFFACQGNGDSNSGADKPAQSPTILLEDSLTSVVMRIHDEVMPRMGEINRLQRQLRQWLQDNPHAPAANREEVLSVLDWLSRADEGMMSWMAEFRQPANLRDSLSHEDIVGYLQEEQKRVQKVHDDITGSIEAAKQLLQTLNESSK